MSDFDLSRRQLVASAGMLAAAPLLAAIPSQPASAAAPPMLGIAQPTLYRFRLGDFEVTMISDSATFIDGPYPIIGANAKEAEVQQLMRDNLLPPNKYRPGFTPEQIDIVVLSHGHPDHIGGVMEAGKPLFPNARYVIGGIEYDFWAGDKPSGDIEKFAVLFRDYVVPLADKTSFLKPGDEVVPGIRAVEAYGHTPGHLAFDIESDGKRILFWGDCAHHQVASLVRPDWHCVFDIDKAKGAETRARMFDMVATDKVAVSGFHMPFPSLGYVERRKNGGYRWLAHTYQLDL